VPSYWNFRVWSYNVTQSCCVNEWRFVLCYVWKVGEVVTRVLWSDDITRCRHSEILNKHYTKENQPQWYWNQLNVMYMIVQMSLNSGVWYVAKLSNHRREWSQNANCLSCQHHGRWWGTNSERLFKHSLLLELHHRVLHTFCVWWWGIYNILIMSYCILKFVANSVTKFIRGSI
jgi:hypothetical protein